MSTITIPKATLADLAKTQGKAELIGGRIVTFMATGRRPSRIASRIFRSLDDYAERTKIGEAYNDNIGFAVAELSSGRESFSPDASFAIGSKPEDDMDFLEGAPIFAVEVRSKTDYGPAMEVELAAKRADYFEAGTQVVWDVDPIANVIRSYSALSADRAIIFSPGEKADAGSALPGWTVDVDEVLQP